MALPNLTAPSSIVGKTARYAVTGSLAPALAAPGTGKTYKINSIFCCNVASPDATVDISVSIYDGSDHRYIAKTIAVPADATQIISTKETYFYLEEADSIYAAADQASKAELIISYEEIS